MQLIGGMVFDIFQGESPAAGDCTKSASYSTPSFEVAALTVMPDMAGTVRRNYSSSTFAFRYYVVLVKLIGRDGLIAEVAAHIDILLLQVMWFTKNHPKTKA